MRTEDWFGRWALEHVKRHEHQWPPFRDPESGQPHTFWASLLVEFRRRGITEDVAREASQRMFGEEQVFPSGHPHRLTELAAAIYRENQAREGVEARSPKDQAAYDSRDCPECGGSGLSTRVKRDGTDFDVRTARGTPATLRHVVVSCTCPMGDWIRAHHDKPPWPHLGDPGWREHTATPGDLVADLPAHREPAPSPSLAR